MSAPRRKVEMVLTLGADSFNELERALHALTLKASFSAAREERGAEPMGGEGLSGESTSGGPGSGWIYSVRADGLPHEEYFEAIRRELEAKRAAEVRQ